MSALLIIIPLLAGFLFIPFKEKAKYILPLVVITTLIILLLLSPDQTNAMGGWKAPFGIVLVLDSASYYSLLVVNIVFLLISLMPQIVEKGYSVVLLILLASTNGLVLTGDIFNSFVFLEITAVAAYIIAFSRKNPYGAFKYLILGGISGAFYLLGAIYAYIGTGSLNFADISVNIKEGFLPIVALLIFIGIGVESKIFPLAGWVPDVYDSGSPLTPVILGTGVTFTIMYLFGRIFITVFHGYFLDVVFIFGLLTIVLGELAALRQNKLIKALAFSSIAQAGLVLSTISLGGYEAIKFGYFHLLNDISAKLVLFIIAATIAHNFTENKIAGVSFSIASFSLIGFPLFAGFRSKLLILQLAFSKDNYLLPAVVLFATVIEAAYILKWNIKLWHSTNTGEEKQKISWNVNLILLIVALLIIFIGIFPDLYLKMAQNIADGLTNYRAYVTNVLGGM
ncbi:MAG: Na+/H+ antiporter subunit D [Thermosipho sp. (in: Bacteria)]|nr:Na+/H+ antiporter subunit D [Thermosipho sp. (in: thermotogales)]